MAKMSKIVAEHRVCGRGVQQDSSTEKKDVQSMAPRKNLEPVWEHNIFKVLE
jgi:hypothetical protein